MPLVAAAICPQPVLLVSEAASGAAAELDDLRAACRAAVDAVVAAEPGVTVVVGPDGTPRARSLAPWGVDVAVDVPEPLPLALLVGGWLTAGGTRSFRAIGDASDPVDCARVGRDLAMSSDRVGLVVMGDGSARRTERAPGYVDPRAVGYDDAVARALGAADTAALLALDPALARELMSTGRAPWQVLAGAAGDARFDGRLGYADAPYGVGYFVATWTRV